MIDPLAQIVDIDPAWGELHDVVRRARLGDVWVYVLHRGGRVVRVVGETAGSVQVGDDVTDPVAVARAVRAASGAGRAVVIDSDQLPDLVRSAVAGADPAQTRPGFRSEVTRHYWASAAVATDPEPPVAVWAPLEEAMRAHAPALLEVRVELTSHGGSDWLADKPTLVTYLTVEHGLVTRVSSRAPAVAASAGLDIRLSWRDLFDLLTDPDPIGLVDELVAAGAVVTGVEWLTRFIQPLERRPSQRGDRRGDPAAPGAPADRRAGVL